MFYFTSLATVENCSCSSSPSSRRSKIASKLSPNKSKLSPESAIFESVFGFVHRRDHVTGTFAL